MKVKETFLELVKTTVPHGYEHTVMNLIPNVKRDHFGNGYLQIGEEKPKMMFTSHLDTYSFGKPEKVNVKFSDNFIHTDGKTILGADDKAGVVVMLSMIEAQIPGLYYFFVGEEIGRLGSRYVAESFEFDDIGSKVSSVISFDRKGYNSVITHQSRKRTCQDDFAHRVCESLNESGLKIDLDNGGSATDSLSFHGRPGIVNCTNISVGYFNAHHGEEKQDIEFLEMLCKASTSFDWNKLAA
jgi:putative aminopeptidase FrvX